MINDFYLHPAAGLPREERSVQSTQFNATSGNSLTIPNIYTVQGPRGRDGRDGVPGSKGEKGDTGLQGPPGLQGMHFDFIATVNITIAFLLIPVLSLFVQPKILQ